MFRNEMSAEARPSLDGMPEEVLAKARRARRARTAKIAAAAFAAVAVRDDGEFVAFVERSGGRLCETAFLLCRDWNLAQDLTQITFIKVYLSWRRIRHDDPYHYSKKVLLRAYLDHKRLKSSGELRTDAVPDRPAPADAAELRLTLLDALGRLSPRDRAIIVLRYWEDHSIQTVSELLDRSPGVVKVQSMRALAKLRVLLGEDEVPPPSPHEPGARDAIPRPPVAQYRTNSA